MYNKHKICFHESLLTGRQGYFTIAASLHEVSDPVAFLPNMTLCHHYTSVVPDGSHDNIHCNQHVTGRHVYVIRDDFTNPDVFESYHMNLCEVMVHGFKPIGSVTPITSNYIYIYSIHQYDLAQEPCVY